MEPRPETWFRPGLEDFETLAARPQLGLASDPGSAPAVYAPSVPLSVGNHVQALAPVYVYDSTTQESALKLYTLTSANGKNRAVHAHHLPLVMTLMSLAYISLRLTAPFLV
jgi:hypothetical protein